MSLDGLECQVSKLVNSDTLPRPTTQGHRALVFAQTRQVLDILEAHVQRRGWPYRRMDGVLPIKQRLTLIDEYNADASIYVFLLTTKVGGLGINLVRGRGRTHLASE